MNDNDLEIIAEIGINFNGDFNLIQELIRQAKLGGSNSIKLQLYNSQKLFGNDLRKKYELSISQLNWIKECCDYYQIELFASVFDEYYLQICEDLKIKKYKIASILLNNEDLINKIALTNKPLYISLGKIDYHDKIPEYILNLKNKVLFNCISYYPVKFDFAYTEQFKFDKNKNIIGFSDHSYGISSCLYAISMGAKKIEKHFTLNKSDNTNRDHIGSMDLEELKILNTYGRELFYLRNKFLG